MCNDDKIEKVEKESAAMYKENELDIPAAYTAKDINAGSQLDINPAANLN